MLHGTFQQRAVRPVILTQERDVAFRRGQPFQIRQVARIFRRRAAGNLIILFLVIVLPVVPEGFVEFGAAKVLFIRFHPEQVVGAHAEQVAERRQQRYIGHRRVGLPAADRLRGNGQQLGEIFLRQSRVPAQSSDSLSEGHRNHPLLIR